MNENLLAIQKLLTKMGHNPEDNQDGRWGPTTEGAVSSLIEHDGQPINKDQLELFEGFNPRSLKNLKGVHPDLVKVMNRARELSPVPFTVIEGLRTVARQKELVSSGASKTMNSRHLTGHAVDIVPHRPDGSMAFDWPLYYRVAPVVKKAAQELGVPLEWGGDWKTFKDGPHFQLPWGRYPA